jgi:hypothetical protein
MESHNVDDRESSLKGAGSGFPKLVRETMSKNAMLPGLTYFYCNSVSQEKRRLPAEHPRPSLRDRTGHPPLDNRNASDRGIPYH